MRPGHHGLFIELLRTYMPSADVICEILGYKYRYFVDAETPRSLYIITALLLQFGLIKLEEIYKWVSASLKHVCVGKSNGPMVHLCCFAVQLEP